MEKEEKQISSEQIYKGRIIDLYLDSVLCPGGIESKREYVTHKGGAGILVVDKENYVYLVKQFRYAYREELFEIPAGKLEEGENPLETAKRELEEETGLISNHFEEYGVLYPSPGYTNEKLFIYKTTPESVGQTRFDSDEFIDLYRIKIDEAFEMVKNGVIKDAKTVYAICRYMAEQFGK